MRWTEADVSRIAGKLREKVRAPLKYHNQPTMLRGKNFDSKLEAKRYGELELMEKAGVISNLQFHRAWPLHVNGIRIGYYESDATYIENGQTVIEDAKGVVNAMYAWKKKHVRAEYGIEIREVRA